MKAFRNSGVDAKLLVVEKLSNDEHVVSYSNSIKDKIAFIAERLQIFLANKLNRKFLFKVDTATFGRDISKHPLINNADIIILNWINQGAISNKAIKNILQLDKPVIWNMHDMWCATGICHHARECDKYHQECHHCPYIYKGGGKKDLSNLVFKKKKEIYQLAPVTFVTCSRWLKERASQSILLNGHTIVDIPNPINTSLFKPQSMVEARKKMRLPNDKKLILFGSVKVTDKRKGIDYFIESCKLLAEKSPNLKEELGVVVYGKNSEYLKSLIPFQVYALDYISSEKELVNIYNAVDLYVTPSLEENLPTTIMEAMSCGVPCVGFNVGGIPEMIDHLHNGYVAEYKSAEDLSNGVIWALSESEYQTLSGEAYRKAISNYSESIVAKKYIDIYNKITGNHA